MSVAKYDSFWMRKALALAKRAWGLTTPNPMVGAVIVRNGMIAGRGWHEKAGLPHAEINALKDFSGLPGPGVSMYVTLEPCSTSGRTPPCTDAIIESGIKRVVIGCLDPNPLHSGRAAGILKNAGIKTVVGVEETKCRALNEAFFKWIETGRPFVLLKMAMTLDGKIATASGQSRWITGPEARSRVQKLRRWADAVMVGADTARSDSPSLRVREPADWSCQPRRIVVSSRMTSEELACLMPGEPAAELVSASGREEWLAYMNKLGSEKVTALLVEGGGELAAALLEAGLVDKVEFYIAPKILGGRGGRPVVGGADPESLADAMELKNVRVRMLGKDILLSGYL